MRADLFATASGGKINLAWNGRDGAEFYAEDSELGSVLIPLTLGEVEALRDMMDRIARQIHEANPRRVSFSVELPASMTHTRMTLSPFTMTVGDTAKALNLSQTRLRQLDDELQPQRLPSGQRRYNPDLVVAYAKRRSK